MILLQVLILLIGFALAGVMQTTLNPNPNRLYFFIVPLFAFGVNLFAFKISQKLSFTTNLTAGLSLLFAVKFFSYIIISIVFFLIEKDSKERLLFIGYLFIIYLLNTVILLSNFAKNQKKHI